MLWHKSAAQTSDRYSTVSFASCHSVASVLKKKKVLYLQIQVYGVIFPIPYIGHL